jgi:hypothetical protein
MGVLALRSRAATYQIAKRFLTGISHWKSGTGRGSARFFEDPVRGGTPEAFDARFTRGLGRCPAGPPERERAIFSTLTLE